jgi:DNA-directed RNA polymerase specialized sigma24 family protein
VEQVHELVVRAATAPSLEERVEAYGRLVERFRDMACGYAYSIVGDFHLAEDVAQEAFIVAFGKLGQLQQPEAFPGKSNR